jgi:rhodanese-related sulfurtransferase
MIGRNDVNARYLYVTDGGHYENLGLVELLRRGCTRVFCLDASGGSVGGELGDAVAIARSELGVEIKLDPTPLTPEGQPPTARQDVVSGTITYPKGPQGEEGMQGTIVYARNVISPGEPWDIRAHQLEDPRFPHDSTLDQLYTDQKFESYRALGAEAAAHAVQRMTELAPRLGHDNHALAPGRVRELLDVAAIQLVDVRDQFAYDIVHVDGAMHVQFATLQRTGGALRRDYRIVFVCEDGKRSGELARAYRQIQWDASSVAGGMARWVGDRVPLTLNVRT